MGSQANTEKKMGANYEQLLRAFSCFQGQKKKSDLFEYSSVRTNKLHITTLQNLQGTFPSMQGIPIVTLYSY